MSTPDGAAWQCNGPHSSNGPPRRRASSHVYSESDDSDECDSGEEVLPRALAVAERGRSVSIASDRRTFYYSGHANHAHDVGCVRADAPLPTRSDLFYFEVSSQSHRCAVT